MIKISLKFILRGTLNNIRAVVYMMAWRWPGDKPLFVPILYSLLTHLCGTRPQWVNLMHLCTFYVDYPSTIQGENVFTTPVSHFAYMYSQRMSSKYIKQLHCFRCEWPWWIAIYCRTFTIGLWHHWDTFIYSSANIIFLRMVCFSCVWSTNTFQCSNYVTGLENIIVCTNNSPSKYI